MCRQIRKGEEQGNCHGNGKIPRHFLAKGLVVVVVIIINNTFYDDGIPKWY